MFELFHKYILLFEVQIDNVLEVLSHLKLEISLIKYKVSIKDSVSMEYINNI